MNNVKNLIHETFEVLSGPISSQTNGGLLVVDGVNRKAYTRSPGFRQDMIAAHESSTLIQACALSTLITPRGMNPCGDPNQCADEYNTLGFDGGLLSTLVKPLLSMGKKANNTAEMVPTVVDPMNPWNFLIARNLSQRLSAADNQHQLADGGDLAPPTRVVTTSSTSSVSDLRSNNTSSTDRYGRRGQNNVMQDNEGRHCGTFVHETRQALAAFSSAIQEPVNTLCAPKVPTRS